MRKSIFRFLNNAYGTMMTISFFAGLLPIFPFLVAIAIGGTAGESICLFLYKCYYPYVIMMGSCAIVIGLIAMYVGKLEALSIKEVSGK